jgi:hypothetical protein
VFSQVKAMINDLVVEHRTTRGGVRELGRPPDLTAYLTVVLLPARVIPVAGAADEGAAVPRLSAVDAAHFSDLHHGGDNLSHVDAFFNNSSSPD